MHMYSIRYRRHGNASRVHRMTVVARNADEARAYAAIKDPQFGSTVTSPRKGREAVEPESADPITQAKYRDELMEGVAHFEWHGHDIEVDVV